MKKTGQADNERNLYEFRLQEEINFWKHMIEECRRNDRNAEIPRMFEAMALAEYRLLQVNDPESEDLPH